MKSSRTALTCRSRTLRIDVINRLLLTLTAVFILTEAGLVIGDKYLISLLNIICPSAMALILVWSAYRLVKSDSLVMWTPLPWFLVSSAVYFGIGPLVYSYGNPFTLYSLNRLFPVSDVELMRTVNLDTAGIGMVLLAYLALVEFFGITQKEKSFRFNGHNAQLVAATFLAIGLPVKYGLIIPYIFGISSHLLPGFVQALGILPSCAIIPMIALVNNGYRRWRAILILLIVLELGVSILEFSKLTILMTIAVIGLGSALNGLSTKRITVGIIVLGAVYILTVPMVSFGRHEISLLNGNYNTASFAQRVEILLRYSPFERPDPNREDADRQAWWARLNYAASQSFAMEQYDHDRPGSSLKQGLIILVPRFFWPGKPMLSDVGENYNYEMTGRKLTWNAPGIFGEAYWNGGWICVGAVAIGVGFLFFGFTRYSMHHIVVGNFVFLPTMIYGIRLGCRPDGWVALEYIGGVGIAVVLHFLFLPLLLFGRNAKEKLELKPRTSSN